MKNKIIFLFVLTSLILSSCLRSQEYSTDDWTKIEYFYENGSLPPPYHYEYMITIMKDLKGTVKFLLGYDDGKSPVLNYEFTFTNEQLEILNKSIKKSKVLTDQRNSFRYEELTEGGSSMSLKITVVTDKTEVLEFNRYVEGKYKDGFEKLLASINNLVPENVWNEFKQKKEEQENSKGK